MIVPVATFTINGQAVRLRPVYPKRFSAFRVYGIQVGDISSEWCIQGYWMRRGRWVRCTRKVRTLHSPPNLESENAP